MRRVTRRWGEVQVPKCGWVRFRWTRALPADLGMARVTVDRAGRWHVSFPAPQPALARRAGGGPVGIDRGVRTALVTSGGQALPGTRDRRPAGDPVPGAGAAAEQAGQGVTAAEKTRRAMAQITAAVTDRRRDWAEKISTRLVTEHDLIVVEKLNTPGMVRKPKAKPDPEHPGGFLPNGARSKAGLNRAILGSCWGLFARRAEQKAAASGAAVIYVDPRFTSQQCHVCGHTAPANRDSQAVFRCQRCGHGDHADVNAARNILARGLATTASCARPGARGPRPHNPPAPAGAAGTSPQRGMSHAAGTPALQGGADVKKVGSTWVGGSARPRWGERGPRRECSPTPGPGHAGALGGGWLNWLAAQLRAAGQENIRPSAVTRRSVAGGSG